MTDQNQMHEQHEEPLQLSEIDKLRARIAELENVKHDPSLAEVFSLNQSCARLLALFMSSGFLTQREIEDRLKFETPPKLLVYRLRKRLEVFGIEIENKRNMGWMLSPSMKLEVEKHLKVFAV
jgi:hypothetical protein